MTMTAIGRPAEREPVDARERRARADLVWHPSKATAD